MTFLFLFNNFSLFTNFFFTKANFSTVFKKSIPFFKNIFRYKKYSVMPDIVIVNFIKELRVKLDFFFKKSTFNSFFLLNNSPSGKYYSILTKNYVLPEKLFI